MLLNLVSNALKYNREGGSVIIARADVGRWTRLSVADTGRGIAPDLLPRVFVAFDRLGAEETTIQGTGLGLALTRGIVAAMGGEVGVESTLGQGSTFWIELETTDTQDLAPAAAADAADEEAAVAIAGTILYIEDNPSNRQLIERLMEPFEDVTLLLAARGQLGLHKAREHRPDVVLLDVNLPDLNGEHVLAELQADPRTCDIPVIMVSADATAVQIERLELAGANAYVTKPIDVPLLLRTIHVAIRESRSDADG